MEIRVIDSGHQEDICIKNEPFEIWGRMKPSFTEEGWNYTTEQLPPQDITEMCFPDENYDYDAMCKDSFFLGAYDGDDCIGLAVLQHGFFAYMYLLDLKVSRKYRGKGIGSMLIARAGKLALENGYRGLYTQGQDNNLSACLFYVKNGFRIGGFDTDVYKGTAQEGKSDIIFYLDA